MSSTAVYIENIKLRERVAELERLLRQSQAMEQLQAAKLAKQSELVSLYRQNFPIPFIR